MLSEKQILVLAFAVCVVWAAFGVAFGDATFTVGYGGESNNNGACGGGLLFASPITVVVPEGKVAAGKSVSCYTAGSDVWVMFAVYDVDFRLVWNGSTVSVDGAGWYSDSASGLELLNGTYYLMVFYSDGCTWYTKSGSGVNSVYQYTVTEFPIVWAAADRSAFADNVLLLFLEYDFEPLSSMDIPLLSMVMVAFCLGLMAIGKKPLVTFTVGAFTFVFMAVSIGSMPFFPYGSLFVGTVAVLAMVSAGIGLRR